jgi:hypothetical protein
MKTKICLKCKEEKLITEFHKHSCRKDGFSDWCKQCKNKLTIIGGFKNEFNQSFSS